jgi:pyruvate formate lyase activating enzyme
MVLTTYGRSSGFCVDPIEKKPAANIDLKGFTDDFYRSLCSGELQPILDTLEYVRHETDCWLEITTLLIPGKNDSPEELRRLSEWIRQRLGPDTPLHFSAFHPDWRMRDVPATPPATLQNARNVAMQAGLRYVYSDREGHSSERKENDDRRQPIRQHHGRW